MPVVGSRGTESSCPPPVQVAASDNLSFVRAHGDCGRFVRGILRDNDPGWTGKTLNRSDESLVRQKDGLWIEA